MAGCLRAPLLLLLLLLLLPLSGDVSAGTVSVGVVNITNVFTSFNVTPGQLFEIPAGKSLACCCCC